jgi:indole-3-glycerol phosphate synthase
MNLLSTIAAYKRTEVAEKKEHYPVSLLEHTPLFDRIPLSLTKSITEPGASGIIAEFKRQSPSKGTINISSTVEEVTAGYINAGASALSVLTDFRFFGGGNGDLIKARKLNHCPILRKDFIIDPYQVIEAKSIGADAILLIASILTPGETLILAALARSLGLETILEVHGNDELSHFNEHISIIGVNNRNLADFTVSLDISLSLAEFIPHGKIAISESGIHDPADVHILKRAGFKGFLIGEQFMSAASPAAACKSFISRLNPIASA